MASKRLFSETVPTHLARLRQAQPLLAQRKVKMWRRALTLKRQGLTPLEVRTQMGDGNCTWTVADATEEQLMDWLNVQRRDGTYVPAKNQPSPDLFGQTVTALARSLDLPVGPATLARGSDKRALAESGKMLGRPPYGYEKLPSGDVIVVEDEAETVCFLFSELVDGAALPKIAAMLNEMEIPTRSGKPWNNDTLRDMVHSPTYAGYILYRGSKHRHDRRGGELFEGQHEALVSWADFLDAQDCLAEIRYRTPGKRWECEWENMPEDPRGQVE